MVWKLKKSELFWYFLVHNIIIQFRMNVIEGKTMDRPECLIKKYKGVFGDGKPRLYKVPGRSEIGGNHTDHQMGKVLAAAVNLNMWGAAEVNGSRWIQVYSDGYGHSEISLDDTEAKAEEAGSTAALIRGVAAWMKAQGYSIGGFNAYIKSDIPRGAGLSSSAAFEVLIGKIFSDLFNEDRLTPALLARAGWYSENVYFGKPCGLMDQMVCAGGGLIKIDFKAADAPKVYPVKGDFGQYCLCIIDAGESHADLRHEYAAISLEMKQVSQYFGKEVLREVDEGAFYSQIKDLRKTVGDRALLRAIHFFEEEKRVDRAAEALERGDMKVFLEQVKASGDSSFKYLQNVYRGERPEIQSLSLALAISEEILAKQGVSRVHGGGFAGTIQTFVQSKWAAYYLKRMDKIFGDGACRMLGISPSGAEKINL